jgi:hypothetical protein
MNPSLQIHIIAAALEGRVAEDAVNSPYLMWWKKVLSQTQDGHYEHLF